MKALSLYPGRSVGRLDPSLKKVFEAFQVVMQLVCLLCPQHLPRSSTKLTIVVLVSFSGLTYLALWICAKFSIAVPILAPWPKPADRSQTQLEKPSVRSRAAAPPTYLVVCPLFAIGLATYISLTRYSDFWHHGFDVIVGAILGTATAWLGFYWYHLPTQYGGGWAWAPRNAARAFGHGIDIFSYGDDAPSFAVGSGDLEAARGRNHRENWAEDGVDMVNLGPSRGHQQPERCQPPSPSGCILMVSSSIRKQMHRSIMS